MIKAEVVFDGDKMIINDKIIYLTGGLEHDVCCSVDGVCFLSVEQAIKYCLEN